MASLQNEQIDQSYQGLIKTSDNAALSGTAKAIQDGAGGATNIEMSNTATNFVSGTVDFTGSTVSGLPGGAAGLENGTGADSLQSAAALTTTAADAAGSGSIALGDGASATRQESVAIGQGAEANGSGSEGSIAIGHGSVASANRGIAIGINGTTNSSEGIVIGDDVDISGSDRSVAIGGAITISGGNDKVAIGTSASVTGQRGLAFGQNASATANEAIAIGYNVTAANAETLSVKALETQADSTPTAGGIIMSDAGGTDRRINIDASGNLQIDSTAVGGGGSAGLESGTGTDSMQSAASLTTTAADAQSAGSIVLGNGAVADATGTEQVVIGNNARADHEKTVAIGDNAQGHFQAVAIGRNSKAGTTSNKGGCIAIGNTSHADTQNDAIAIGTSSSAQAEGAVALGRNVSATIDDTVSVKALEVQTDSTPTAGGIIMADAGGTDRRLNINASGNLQVDSNVVGAASSFSLPRTAGTSSSGCDVIYSSVLIPGGTFAAGDILQLSGAMSASGSTSTIWSAYWISTNGTVGGSATEEVNCGQLALSDANWAVGFQKNLYVNVADGTGTGTELVTGMGYSDVDGAVNTSGADQKTPDWTSDLYLVNRSCIQAGNPVAYVDHGAVLKKIN